MSQAEPTADLPVCRDRDAGRLEGDRAAASGRDAAQIEGDRDSPTVRIRQADAADSAILTELLHEIMVHHGVEPPPADALRDTLEAIFASTTHLFLVAEAAGVVVGTCSLIFSLSTWSAGPVCEVQDVIVTERSRRSEVGRRLLEAASAVATDRGCVRLFLNAESFNLDAHAFYRTLGLSEKTALYFERSLSPAG